MKKIDVLFIYETRVRELESVCLLKAEMERRGYTTAVLNTWNEIGHKGHKYEAKVVVAPSMYNDGIFDFVKDLSGNVHKLVNLQWEQIGTVGDKTSDDTRYLLKGFAHQCVNICWGDDTYDRLLTRAKIDEKYLRKTGHVAMDFCRPEYRNYYMSREDLFAKYDIPQDKEVNLFISSFSYVNLPRAQQNENLFRGVNKFIEVSCQSFNGVLGWFDALLTEYPEQVFVYRPHPAEFENDRLKEMQNKYPHRFFVITEHSVKQWIATTDRVYTWFSTATAEAFAFGKPVAILRPTRMPEEMDTMLFEHAKKIEVYEDFVSTIKSDFEQVLSSEDFGRFYRCDETPAYMRVCDAIEDVLNNDEYLIVDSRPQKKEKLKDRIKKVAHKSLSCVAKILPKGWHCLNKYRHKVDLDEYTKQKQSSNYASEKDIRCMQDKIEEVFFGVRE